MPNYYDMKERLIFSEGVANSIDFKTILLSNIPNAISIEKANEQADRDGTDYWIKRKGLPDISVDLKARDDDPIIKFKKDDLALETFSVIEKNIPGWTRNPDKRTDYILWFFVPTKRWVLVPFPLLCQVFIQNWIQWKATYKTCQQESEKWHSECVFVPRIIVWRAIYETFGGVPDKEIEKKELPPLPPWEPMAPETQGTLF